MIKRMSAVCLWALGGLAACGGESNSPNGASAGTGASAGSAAGGSSNGGSAGEHTASGGSAATNAAGGTIGIGNGGSNVGGTIGIGNGGSNTGGALDMSDPGSGTCTAFTPCGGALAGTWRLDSICQSPPLVAPSDSCSMIEEVLSASGTLTFRSDGTVDPSNVHLELALNFPPSCIADATACDTLSASTYGPCTFTADGCRCTPTTTTTMSTMETYAISGNSVTLTNAGKAQTAYYCVNGNQLFLRGRASNSSAYVYVMTRQ